MCWTAAAAYGPIICLSTADRHVLTIRAVLALQPSISVCHAPVTEFVTVLQPAQQSRDIITRNCLRVMTEKCQPRFYSSLPARKSRKH